MLYKGDTLYVDWLEDGIAELVFDAPGSVNKLDTATVASLGQALDVLEKQSDLKRAAATLQQSGLYRWRGYHRIPVAVPGARRTAEPVAALREQRL